MKVIEKSKVIKVKFIYKENKLYQIIIEKEVL